MLMMTKKMQSALNSQVNAELYSAYLYLSMEAYLQSVNLPGFANWMRVQTQEELAHAMKIYDYINDRGAGVTLGAIAAPKGDWKSPLDVAENVLRHERKVTALINDLASLAAQQKDHASCIFLQWFVSEQVEEEKNATGLVENLKLIQKDARGLYMLDRELARRVFTPPAASVGPA
jgi:ferritin